MNMRYILAAALFLCGPTSTSAQPTAPVPQNGQAVPFIVNGGQCEDECDEYMSRQLMGTFATSSQACKSAHRFYVYGNQVGLEDGAALMITSSRLQRSEDGNSMLMFVTGSISEPGDKGDNEKAGTGSLEYNMDTNRLTVSSTLLREKTVYLRCRVALPPRYGEQ
jgi:hypothetical protein